MIKHTAVTFTVKHTQLKSCVVLKRDPPFQEFVQHLNTDRITHLGFKKNIFN